MKFFRRRRPPVGPLPSVAAYSDPAVAAVVEAARPDQPVLGLGHYGRPIVAPSGHLLVVSGAGGGRSTFMRAVGAQALRDGHRLVVLDIAGRSQRWARYPLPGCDVTFEDDMGGIADRLVTLRQEVLAALVATDWRHDPPRVTVLLDDAPSTLGRLTERWRSRGNTGRGDAVDAYRDLLYMGRAEGVRLVVGTSGVTTRTFGPEMREFFTRVVSARVTRGTWACVTGGAPHPGQADCTPGSFHLASGDVTPFRGLLMSDAEAGDVATSGREVAY